MSVAKLSAFFMALVAQTFVLHVCISSASMSPPVDVYLNSTLYSNSGNFALSGQRVMFTCVARNTSILEWNSDEYINRYGVDIQIYNVGSTNNVSSRTIPTTYATRVSVTEEDGVTVIVSQLFITASEQFPTSSVTCRRYGQGSNKTISFEVTVIAMELQDVTLIQNSTCEQSPLPEQRVVFTCVTRGTDILIWEIEYIGANDHDIIPIHGTGDRDYVTSQTIETTYATRVSVSVETGIPVIVSQLFITASEQFPNSSVTCRINHDGPRKTIYFNTTGPKTCEATTAYTNVTVTVNKTVVDDQDSQRSTSRTTIIAVTCSILAMIIIIIALMLIIGLVYGFRKSPDSDRLEEDMHNVTVM